MTIQLYGHRLSQPCRAIELLCMNNDVPYHLHVVDFVNGECKSDPFSKLNPQQQIPVIKVNDFVLTESHAIMKYICRTEPNVASHWYPEKDAKFCAQMDRWLDWHHVNVRSVSVPIVHAFIEVHHVPAMLKREIIELRIKPWNMTFQKSANILERQLADKGFVVGDQSSVVDLSLGCEFYQLYLLGYDFSRYKSILQWFMNLERAVKNWKESHKEVEEFSRVFLKENAKFFDGILVPASKL